MVKVVERDVKITGHHFSRENFLSHPVLPSALQMVMVRGGLAMMACSAAGTLDEGGQPPVAFVQPPRWLGAQERWRTRCVSANTASTSAPALIRQRGREMPLMCWRHPSGMRHTAQLISGSLARINPDGQK